MVPSLSKCNETQFNICFAWAFFFFFFGLIDLLLVYLGLQFCEAFGRKRFTFCLFFKGSKKKELCRWGSGEDLGGAEEEESRNILYEKEFN